ncbi:B-cell lymphoma 3 protein [Didymosphaeria variabile]|uniref:B-cell lymphoma 3 protein n=1 Tax=Didymosphaeria variabile TaxID=1932322 RepID=A0A9W8XVE5_9PLEO|nr:B-cell lymphoma 3 protein [Didymosphaeria variabile]KAJ4359921.1 B-cell lymphoma 3 protein [Didymosphaeria variabile]
MSGLEIFGAVGVAASLIELAKKCSARLEKGRRTYHDLAALQRRVDVLTETINSVSDVLEDIRKQYHEHAPTTAETALWQHMESVLKIYHKNLVKLDSRLEEILHKRSKALTAIPADITRRAEDMRTYIQALDRLKLLFILISQRQLAVSQNSMHADLRGMRDSQEDKINAILQNIKEINDRFTQQQQARFGHTASVPSQETLIDSDDKLDTLSTHLNSIVIDVQASFSNPQKYSARSLAHEHLQSEPSPTHPDLDTEHSPDGSVQDITHIEPLQELAQRFKIQAELDLEHENYKDARCYQLESIKCFKELHDVYNVPFETYHEMRMKLKKIYQELGRYEDARQVLEENYSRRAPLAYEPGLVRQSVVLEGGEDMVHEADFSHEMAELLLKQFDDSKIPPDTSSDGQNVYWNRLREAEKHAKRAFRIRRELYGMHDDSCKQTASLLFGVYNRFRDKSIYAETYRDLYLLDHGHRQNPLLTIPSTSNSSMSRSLVPSVHSSLADAVRDHNTHFDDVVAIMGRMSLKELEETSGGKSVTMLAMDCKHCKQGERCGLIVDKLLRLEVSRDALLVYAVKKQRLDYCRLMLDHGANIDWLDPNHFTPLMHAVKIDSAAVVNFLLVEHADVNVVGERGLTALHMATGTRNEHIVQRLLDVNGVHIDATNASGLTALHHCVKQNNLGCAKRLIRAGADWNIKDKSGPGRTPLWIAVNEDKYTFVKTLLKLGARINMDDVPRSASRDIRNLLEKYQARDPG